MSAPSELERPHDETPAPPNPVLVIVRGLAGAIVGAVVGYFVFRWLAVRGYYAIMIPGALIGLGAGLSAGGRSLLLGFLCVVMAVATALVAEWTLFPFAKDKSLEFFLTHVHNLPTFKLVMIGLGAIFAWWFGQAR